MKQQTRDGGTVRSTLALVREINETGERPWCAGHATGAGRYILGDGRALHVEQEPDGSLVYRVGDDGRTRKIADALHGMEPSTIPLKASAVSAWTWATDVDGRTDFRTGENTRESLHFMRENPPTRIKGWRAAFRAAGLAR